MPFYKPLKAESSATRKRTVAGLSALRDQFHKVKFPRKKTTESLILGTWNIRNFDDDRFDYGPREEESFYYLAEIISWFDVIAVQEINEDLWPLKKLMGVLGGHYDYLLTDVTHSGLGGNAERLGFIYDTNKVDFQGVAGEIVLPRKLLIGEDDQLQFSRTPFGVEFESGWFKFMFSTVHIFFGSNAAGDAKYRRRVGEIEAVAKYLAEEARNSDANQILVGDFNIIKPGGVESNALENNGFTTIKNRLGSNRDQTKFYDQISFMSRRNELRLIGQPPATEPVAGQDPELPDRVLQYFDSVYRDDQFDTYKPIMVKRLEEKIKESEKVLKDDKASKSAKAKATTRIKSKQKAMASEAALKKYYDEWRTFQMSDHLPLWIELEIDFTDAYLKYLSNWNPKDDEV
ncbi:MAG: endonuclease/exonuclease/phosphatase family protein [Planctomycetota bacterium]